MFKNVYSNTKLCFRWVIALFSFVLISTNLSSQEIWTTDQFLDFKQGNGDLPYQENLNFLNKAKGMPFVDRYEFRTETDEMVLNQQQYQFRFKFNSNDERKAYDKILIANKNKYKWLQAQNELEVWEEKYKNIVDLYFCQKEMQIIKQDLELLADKKKVLNKILANEASVNVNDWISNETEIFGVLSDSLEIEHQKKEILQKVLGSYRLVTELDEKGFIQISRINEIVTGMENLTSQHPDEGLAMAERELAGAEYRLEQAEAKRWLEFAQIQYQSEDKLSFQREISLGTSITIPSKNNNRVKKNEAALELLEKSYETKLEQDENNRALLNEEAKILSLINQLEEFKEMRENQKLESIFESYSEKKIVSPLVLIEIKRSILAYAKKQFDIEKDIYESYINLLTRKAAFLKVPRINYLKD